MNEEDRQLLLKYAGSVMDQLTKLSNKEFPSPETEEPYDLDTLSEVLSVS